MTMEHSLNAEQYTTISNSKGLTPASPILEVHEDNIAVDVGLRIIRRGPKTLDFTAFGPEIRNADLNLNGISERTQERIFARVEACRKIWKKNIVDLKTHAEDRDPKFQFPFRNDWNFANEPHLLKDATPSLAVAGESLYTAIFELQCDKGLKAISQTLRDVFSKQPRRISISSSDLFLPWGMLYTHPVAGEKLASDGSNWKKEGFWGYQHIVQQNPNQINAKSEICLDRTGVSVLSVNFDDRLSTTLKLPVIDTHIEFIGALGGKNQIKRTRKTELALGFREGRTKLERIVYFYCHGHGSSDDGKGRVEEPHLVLTDDVVTAEDFEDWAKGQDLCTNPLIFINACQGGQMQTMFYESFAVELLKQGAAGLVGAQIDVPAVFASCYGQLVLAEFFAKDKGRVRLGPLLRKLNQTMWDTHNNPLGLVYSLYRGADCFIDWSKSEVNEAVVVASV